MYIGFSTRLKKMGGLRIGGRRRIRGWTAVFVLFGLGMFYMCYYMMLGALWMIYGICWLCFYLPFKGILRLIKKRKIAAAQEYAET